MHWRRDSTGLVILFIAAFVLAVVSNALASRTRRLVLPGYYPNALRVPPPETSTPVASATPSTPVNAPATSLSEVTSTAAMSPAPGNPPLAISTETVGRPAGATSTARAPLPVPSSPTPASPTPASPALPPPAPQSALQRFPPHPDKPYLEISGEDVLWLHKQGALFLDARRTSVYEEGHIAGARSFSVWEGDIDEKVSKLFEERSSPEEQAQPIVIYCSGGACEDSHMLAQKLWGVQFNNALVYKDGFPDWQKRGGAVRSGPNP